MLNEEEFINCIVTHKFFWRLTYESNSVILRCGKDGNTISELVSSFFWTVKSG